MRLYRSEEEEGEEGPLDGMIELLVANSQAPPKEVKGVSQGFLDGEWRMECLSVTPGNCLVCYVDCCWGSSIASPCLKVVFEVSTADTSYVLRARAGTKQAPQTVNGLPNLQ